MSSSIGKELRHEINLDQIGRNLTRLADEKKIGPIYERNKYIDLLACLLRSKEENVLLVGEPGVGKNAIVEGLVSRIASKRFTSPPYSNIPNIYEVSVLSFQANCVYVHDFETRIQNIADTCIYTGAILFFDNINMSLRAGGTVEGYEDRTIANLLLPYLARDEIHIIGATSKTGYKAMLKSNPSFTNRFVVIEIPQTNKKETLEIFEGIKDKLENKYSLTIEKDAINEIIDLSDRFLKWRFFPGKAFEVFKEIIAIRKSLLQGTLGKDKESSKELSEISSEKITKNDVFLYLKHKTGLPASIVHPSATLRKKEVTDYFKARVLGQDDAIEALVYTILNFKSEINDDNKPLGVFLFVGPTGVGKTKLARTLAQYLFGSEDRLLRYDMSEYSVPQSVNRLIGVHGYNWERGKLIEDIVANPFSVILLDEIEKAHPNIYNLLLQVFGEGRLTDSCETTVNFQNSIIIMTSNLGSHLYFKKKIGITNFESDEGLFKKQDVVKFVENFFSPEFFNRLTDIICFNQLSKEIMRKIAKMNLEELLSRDGIKKRNLKIKYSDDILDFLVEKGYNEKYGARPMKRAIEKFVGNKISEAIASQEIKLGEEVSISIDSSKKGIKVISKRNFN